MRTMQLSTRTPLRHKAWPSPTRLKGNSPVQCSRSVEISSECDASRRACLSTVLGLSLAACTHGSATAAVVEEDVAQRVFDIAGEDLIRCTHRATSGSQHEWQGTMLCHGGAAQSVVSISDFRQDASGARVAEGTGSGVVWDRSVLPRGICL